MASAFLGRSVHCDVDAGAMKFHVKVKLTGEGVIPSAWGQDHVRFFQTNARHSPVVAGMVRWWIHESRFLFPPQRIEAWTEVR